MTELNWHSGDIFDPELDCDALIIWSPPGFASMANDIISYLASKTAGLYLLQDSGWIKSAVPPFKGRGMLRRNYPWNSSFCLYKVSSELGFPNYIYVDLKSQAAGCNNEKMQTIIYDALDLMLDFKVKKIAMNGIRTFRAEPEAELIAIVQQWLTERENDFERLLLVDKRAGFEKAWSSIQFADRQPLYTHDTSRCKISKTNCF